MSICKKHKSEISVEACPQCLVAILNENKRLWGVLKELNEGFRHEYGHSDSDRYNRVILYWNKIITKALKESPNPSPDGWNEENDMAEIEKRTTPGVDSTF